VIREDDVTIAAKLAYYPDRNLWHRAQLVLDFTNMPAIAELMFSTMVLHDGMGLAANQIKLPWRIFVMRTPNIRRAFINPELAFPTNSKRIESQERCLSFPGVEVTVMRHPKCIIKYQDINGSDQVMPIDTTLESICVQHETDHLDGRTFVDHLGKMKRLVAERTVKKELKKWQQESKQPKPPKRI